ncbi:hypothetical protein [Pseudonocardia pini]|nr:hypothetical protein [Pseudonocardia pini]
MSPAIRQDWAETNGFGVVEDTRARRELGSRRDLLPVLAEAAPGAR